jgi:hypothetical protein
MEIQYIEQVNLARKSERVYKNFLKAPKVRINSKQERRSWSKQCTHENATLFVDNNLTSNYGILIKKPAIEQSHSTKSECTNLLIKQQQ